MIHLAKHQRRQLCVPPAILPRTYHDASSQLTIRQSRFEQPLASRVCSSSFCGILPFDFSGPSSLAPAPCLLAYHAKGLTGCLPCLSPTAILCHTGITSHLHRGQIAERLHLSFAMLGLRCIGPSLCLQGDFYSLA